MKPAIILIGLLIVGGLALVLFPGPPTSGQSQPPGSSQLAITGSDGNLYLYDLASSTLTPLTTDGVPGARVYSWPTWAADGHLAYFGVNALAAPPYRLGIFIQPPGGQAVRVYESPDEIFTYAYWSPGECPLGDCRDLAVLYTNAGGGLGLRRVRAGADFSVEELAAGAPFYWDWSPDGQAMLWARFRQRLELYDVTSDQVIHTFPEQQGFQRAVDWSPVDNRLLTTVAAPDGTSRLVVFDGEQRITLAEGLREVVAFEWSPDGTQVAYLEGDGGPLRIVDARTGALIATPADNALVFFWSPDGTRVAYLLLTRSGGDTLMRPSLQTQPSARLVWYVYDLAARENLRFAAFVPTQDMIYYLSFFDQFARSHRLWSPDSRYLVYGEMLDATTGVVSLVDTTRPGAPPIQVTEGTIGIFSWQ